MKNLLIFLLFFSIFLVPSISVLGVPIAGSDLLIVTGYLVWGRQVLSILKIDYIRIVFYWMVLFSLLTFLSLIISIYEINNPSIRDLFSVINFFRSSLIFLLGGFIIIYNEVNSKVINSVLFIISLSAIITIFQFFNIFNLGRFLTIIYTSGDKYLAIFDVEGTLNRAVGTIGNPNYSSLFLNVGLLINLAFVRVKIKQSFITLLLIVAIFSTQSRTGMVITLGILIIRFFYLPIKINSVIILSIISSLIFSLYSFSEFYQVKIDELLYRYIQLGVVDSTFGNRSDLIWSGKLELFFYSPWFGIGMNKNMGNVFNTVDNGFLYILLSYGLIGFMFFFIGYIVPYYLLLKTKTNYKTKFFGHGLYIIMSFGLITTEWVKMPKSNTLFYILVGMLVASFAKMELKEEKNE